MQECVNIIAIFLFAFRSLETKDVTSVAKEKLNNFIMGHMSQYFKLVKKRIELEVRN